MARGSVRRHDGGWGYRVDLGADPATGKRRQASKQGFRTKREAELAVQAIVKSQLEGAVPQRSQRTVGAFLDEWLRAAARPASPVDVLQLRGGDRADQGWPRHGQAAVVDAVADRALLPLTRVRRRQERPRSEDGPQHPRRAPQGAVRCRAAGARDAQPCSGGTSAVADTSDRSTWNSEQLREFLDGGRRRSALRGVRVVGHHGHASRRGARSAVARRRLRCRRPRGREHIDDRPGHRRSCPVRRRHPAAAARSSSTTGRSTCCEPTDGRKPRSVSLWARLGTPTRTTCSPTRSATRCTPTRVAAVPARV